MATSKKLNALKSYPAFNREWLKAVIVVNDLTYQSLSDMTGIGKDTIYNMCNGKVRGRQVSKLKCNKVLDVINIPYDFMMYETDENGYLIDRGKALELAKIVGTKSIIEVI